METKKKYVEKYFGRTPKEEKEFEDRHKKVFEIFSKYTFNRVLDVGCGDGNFSILLKAACNAEEIYGIEISEEGLELAKRNGVRAFRLDVDEEILPFENSYFDAVFAGEVIEHLFDPDHFFNEIYRVLKPGGIFVLSTPNLAAIHNRIALLFGFQPFPMGASLKYNIGRAFEPQQEAQSLNHVRVFTLGSLKHILRIYGFEIVKVTGSSAMLPKKTRFLKAIHALDKFFVLFPSLSYRVIVTCTKKICLETHPL